MTDPMDKVTEDKDLLGKIQNFVAGFFGYYDRERRREADKLLRDMLAQRYEEQWQRLSAIQSGLISAKQLEYVDDVERAAIKLRAFIDRVKGAPRGYAGFFDAVRIKQDELDKLYQYDLALLEQADQVRTAIDGLEAAVGSDEDEIQAAIATVVRVATGVTTVYDRRDEAVLSSL